MAVSYTLVALALVVGGGAVACAGILGIEDRGAYVADASAEGAAVLTDSPSGGDASTSADAPVADVTTGDATKPDASPGDAGGDADQTSDSPSTTPADAQPDARRDAGAGDAAADPDAQSGVATCPDPCLLASGLNHPFSITADSNTVYWTEFGDTRGSANGVVRSCPLSGCNAGGPTVLAQGLTNPRGIAVDAQYLYFATATWGGVAGSIWRCPLAGCNGSATSIAVAEIPYGLAVDSTSVYWVDSSASTVSKVGKADGRVQMLYDGGPFDDAGTQMLSPGQCVVDGPFLYLMDIRANALRVAVTDGTVTYLGNGNNGGTYGNQFGLTTDPTHLYFGGNGIIQSAPKAAPGSASVVASASGIVTPIGLEYDLATGMIYWASYGSGSANDGTVGKFAPDGSGARVLQASLVTPEGVAVGDRYAYWISSGTLDLVNRTELAATGALWRTTK